MTSAVPTQNICSSSTGSAIRSFSDAGLYTSARSTSEAIRCSSVAPDRLSVSDSFRLGYLASTARIKGTPIALTPEFAIPIEMSPAITPPPCLIALGLGHRAQDDAGVLVKPLARGG